MPHRPNHAARLARLVVITIGLSLVICTGAYASRTPETHIDQHIEQTRETVLSIQRGVHKLARSLQNNQRIPVFLRRTDNDYTVGKVVIKNRTQRLVQHHVHAKNLENANTEQPATRIGHLTRSAAASGLTIIATIHKQGRTQRLHDRITFNPLQLQPEDSLELVMHEGGLFSRPYIEIMVWRPANRITQENTGLLALLMPDTTKQLHAYKPGSREDPNLRYARTLLATGQPATALNVLLTGHEQATAHQARQALLLTLTEASLAAGLTTRSERLLTRLGRDNAGQTRLARLQLRLARLFLARGKPRKAHQYLTNHIGDQPPDPVTQEWQALMVRVQMAMQHYQAAAALFHATEPLIQIVHDKLENPERSKQLVAYSRYNRAIAYIRSGATKRGRTWLNIVGNMTPTSPEIRALSNKANMVLGWQLLNNGHGLAAVSVFRRIQLDSPFVEKALLGAGWALISQSSQPVERMDRDELIGKRLDNTLLSDFVVQTLIQRGVLNELLYGKHHARTRLTGIVPPRNKAEAVRRALRYWLGLAGPDIRAPAAQEGLLAIAKAFAMLGDEVEAAQRYRKAIDRYEQAIKTVEQAIKRIRDDRWLTKLLGQLTATQSGSDAPSTTPRAWARHAAIHDTSLRYLVREQSLQSLHRRIASINQTLDALADKASSAQTLHQLRQALQRVRQRMTSLHTQARQIIRNKIAQSLRQTRKRLHDYLATAYARLLNLTANG